MIFSKSYYYRIYRILIMQHISFYCRYLIFPMILLDHEQLLQQQLYFLKLPGKTLSNFYIHDSPQNFFHSPSQFVQQQIYRKYELKDIKTTRNLHNSSFDVLTYLFLNIFQQKKPSSDLLQQFKSIFYFSNFNSETVMKLTCKNLNNNTIKKIVVEFLHIINYNQGSLEFMLCKYSIINQIFILFFRLILKRMGVQNAMSQRAVIRNQKILSFILNYFNIPYSCVDGLIAFQGLNLRILIDEQTNKCVIGQTPFVKEDNKKIQNQIKQFERSQNINDQTRTKSLNQISWNKGGTYKSNFMIPMNFSFAKQQKSTSNIHQKLSIQNPEFKRKQTNYNYIFKSDKLRIYNDIINVQLSPTEKKHHKLINNPNKKLNKSSNINYGSDTPNLYNTNKNSTSMFNGNKSFDSNRIQQKQMYFSKNILKHNRNQYHQNYEQRKKIPSFLKQRHKNQKQQRISLSSNAGKIQSHNQKQKINQVRSKCTITEPQSPIYQNLYEWTNDKFYTNQQFKQNSFDTRKFKQQFRKTNIK